MKIRATKKKALLELLFIRLESPCTFITKMVNFISKILKVNDKHKGSQKYPSHTSQLSQDRRKLGFCRGMFFDPELLSSRYVLASTLIISGCIFFSLL